MNRFIKNYIFKSYVARLIFRAPIFLAALYFYFTYPGVYEYALNYHIYGGILGVYVVWAFLMMGMLYSLLPYSLSTMGSRKQHVEIYSEPEEGYSKEELYNYVSSSNSSAAWVLIVWIAFNAIIAILYLTDILGEAELLLISIFYYLSDMICVVIWCPFQSLIMGNRCCVNCRIFNWGWFMICTPLVLIKSFLTWSLFLMSVIVLLRWEITLSKHPERFWSGSNANLQCANCNDKICKIKKPLI